MRVQNITSPRGNKIINQFIIEHKGKEYFQSYSSIIVVKEDEKVTLDEYFWNYSRTTSKYRNIFLYYSTQNIHHTGHSIIVFVCVLFMPVS